LFRQIQVVQRRVDRLSGELEGTEMHADGALCAKIDEGIDRVVRIHVDRTHEPARFVRADG
jgi:hypothetical protein